MGKDADQLQILLVSYLAKFGNDKCKLENKTVLETTLAAEDCLILVVKDCLNNNEIPDLLLLPHFWGITPRIKEFNLNLFKDDLIRHKISHSIRHITSETGKNILNELFENNLTNNEIPDLFLPPQFWEISRKGEDVVEELFKDKLKDVMPDYYKKLIRKFEDLVRNHKDRANEN